MKLETFSFGIGLILLRSTLATKMSAMRPRSKQPPATKAKVRVLLYPMDLWLYVVEAGGQECSQANLPAASTPRRMVAIDIWQANQLAVG